MAPKKYKTIAEEFADIALIDKPKENRFAPGDIVALKSGGPKMTVVRTNGDVGISVIWYSDTSTDSFSSGYHTREFAVETLELVGNDEV
jgi:uncharacterized protein YodC (DUF2158 family)